MKKGTKPATRDDVAGFGNRILGRVDRRFNMLKGTIDRVGARVIRVEAQLSELGAKVDSRLSQLPTVDVFLAGMDRVMAKLEIMDQSLLKQGAALDAHAHRLDRIEGRPS